MQGELFKTLFRNILKNYDLETMDYGEYNRIIMSLYFTIIALTGDVIYIIIDSFSGYYLYMVSDATFLTLYIFTLFIIIKGYISLSKHILIICTNLAYFMPGLSQGKEAGNYLMWFPIFASIFMLFSTKERTSIILLLIFSCLCLGILEYSNYALVPNPTLTREYLNTSYIFTLTSAATLVCLLVYNLTRLNEHTESKLKKLNKKLRKRNVDLKKTNQELDSFVYKASHDLRAPLTSLLGLIEISRNEKDSTKLNEYFGLQEKSIHKLDSYIMQILDLSRNSRSGINIEKVDLKLLIDDCFQQLNYLRHASKIRKTIQTELKADFYSDQKRISIILNNIVSNAFHYYSTTRDDSVIEVKITNNRFYATLTIYDNGQGIDAQHLPKIYDMFYRANEQNTGSGLGLYIVKETLNMLKGDIRIESEVTKWTKITIRIPNMGDEQK